MSSVSEVDICSCNTSLALTSSLQASLYNDFRLEILPCTPSVCSAFVSVKRGVYTAPKVTVLIGTVDSVVYF